MHARVGEMRIEVADLRSSARDASRVVQADRIAAVDAG